MLYKDAYMRINSYPRKTVIASVYDEGNLDSAFTTLKPNFEYPDWSHRTIGEFLNSCKY